MKTVREVIKSNTTKGKQMMSSSEISKNSSLIADLGTLKISEASQRLESSDLKDSGYQNPQTGLVTYSGKKALPEIDEECVVNDEGYKKEKNNFTKKGSS